MLDEAIYDNKVQYAAREAVNTLTASGLNRQEQVSAIAIMVYCYMKTIKERYGEEKASLESQCEYLFKTIHILEAQLGDSVVEFLTGGKNAND